MPPRNRRRITDNCITADRLADKLAMAARERMMLASRDKQLQAQRKRKAAAFLDSLRQTDPASPSVDSSASATAAGW